MRTTIRIDDDLYREVKAKAARSGRTIASVLEDAVRVGLSVFTQTAAGRYVLRPLGGGGPRPGIDLSSNSSVQEALDEGVSLEALR